MSRSRSSDREHERRVMCIPRTYAALGKSATQLLQVIKDVLFEKGLISEKDFELQTLNKTHTLFTRVLEALKEMKKYMNKIRVPKIIPPKDIKKVRA